jgi:hypothetical protein
VPHRLDETNRIRIVQCIWVPHRFLFQGTSFDAHASIGVLGTKLALPLLHLHRYCCRGTCGTKPNGCHMRKLTSLWEFPVSMERNASTSFLSRITFHSCSNEAQLPPHAIHRYWRIPWRVH